MITSSPKSYVIIYHISCSCFFWIEGDQETARVSAGAVHDTREPRRGCSAAHTRTVRWSAHRLLTPGREGAVRGQCRKQATTAGASWVGEGSGRSTGPRPGNARSSTSTAPCARRIGNRRRGLLRVAEGCWGRESCRGRGRPSGLGDRVGPTLFVAFKCSLTITTPVVPPPGGGGAGAGNHLYIIMSHSPFSQALHSRERDVSQLCLRWLFEPLLVHGARSEICKRKHTCVYYLSPIRIPRRVRAHAAPFRARLRRPRVQPRPAMHALRRPDVPLRGRRRQRLLL